MTVGETIITALKSDIVVWHKLTEIGRFRGHLSGSATVLCAVGSTYLLSAAKHELILWQLSDIGNFEAETSGQSSSILGPLSRLQLGQHFGEVSCICHPPTYLNKVLVAGTGGQLELWNIRSVDRIHSFKCLAKDAELPPITAMREANALDVVAIGFATGRIALLNIREDRILFAAWDVQSQLSMVFFSDLFWMLESCGLTGVMKNWFKSAMPFGNCY